MDTILDKKGLSDYILNRLSKLSGLPAEGFCAGGAVANTIYDMVYGDKPPINDIDIFFEEKDAEIRFDFPPGKIRSTEITAETEYGAFFLTTFTRNTYALRQIQKEGMINTIDVCFPYRYCHGEARDANATILMGFDLNCCQVGIDLKTRQLCYTPQFRRFLKTRQMEVMHTATPFHTAIRICKKLQELKCYCDLNAEMNLLSHVPLLFGRDNDMKKTYAGKFGKKHYEIYLKHKEILGRYFDIETLEDGFYAFKPKLQAPFNGMVAGDSPYMLINNYRLLYGGGERSQKTKNEIAIKSELVRHLMIANPLITKCDFTEKHLVKIDRFHSSHPMITPILYGLGLNIQQVISSMQAIERAAKKEGLYVIGMVETHGHNEFTARNKAITDEDLSRVISKYKDRYTGTLKKPENLNKFSLKGMAWELTTVSDLIGEGIRYRHCVGGYADAVKKRRALIFHIETAEGGSTLELKCLHPIKTDRFYYRVWATQHCSFQNSEPPESCKKVAVKLVEYLNSRPITKAVAVFDRLDRKMGLIIRRIRRAKGRIIESIVPAKRSSEPF